MPDRYMVTRGRPAGLLAYTMITERAVAGFRWTLYLHGGEASGLALASVYPGGVASGWLDGTHSARNVAVAFDQAIAFHEAVERAMYGDSEIDTSNVQEVPHG